MRGSTALLSAMAVGIAGCGEIDDLGSSDALVAHEAAALTAPTQINTFALLASGRIKTLDRAIIAGGNVGVSPGSGDSVSTGFDRAGLHR